MSDIRFIDGTCVVKTGGVYALIADKGHVTCAECAFYQDGQRGCPADPAVFGRCITGYHWEGSSI